MARGVGTGAASPDPPVGGADPPRNPSLPAADPARLWWLDAIGTDAVLLGLIDASGLAGATGRRPDAGPSRLPLSETPLPARAQTTPPGRRREV
jgi:hypothetical protein